MPLCKNSFLFGDSTVLVVGLGPAALAFCRKLPEGPEVIVVEPKDFVEFTPGVLRGFCDIEHWRALVAPVPDVLDVASPGASWIKGRVELMTESFAIVRKDTGEESKVPFDYAIVATGSANGIWKPADSCAMSLAAREEQLLAEQNKLRQTETAALNGHVNKGFPRVAVSGAGIVGVELVAEIVERYPGLRSHVVLLSRNDTILPTHPESVSDYCYDWLERNGVEIISGVDCRSYQDWLKAEGQDHAIQYLCAGQQPRLPRFEPPVALDSKGHIFVNSEMRVLSSIDPDELLWASGRVFAFGDCAEVLGLEGAFAKTIYPAEGIASTVACNVELLLQGRDDSCEEVSAMWLSPVIISLGCKDAVMDVSNHKLLTGRAASAVKYLIERSKMVEAESAGCGPFQSWGSLLWKLVPHF